MGITDKVKEIYNTNLTQKIETSVKDIKEFKLGLDDNIVKLRGVVDQYSRKEINLSFIDRFTRMIYANPYHLAKIEFLQYIIFVALIYFYNPLNIKTNYPVFTKLLILTVAFIYVILFVFIKTKVERGEDVDLIEPTETNILVKIFSIIVFFVLFMVLIKGVIWLLINTSIINAVRNMLGIFIAIGVLGIVYLVMRKTINKAKNAPENKFTTFLLKIIMYLPCLLVDTIEYIKYEFNLTTRPVWILLGVEAALIGLYFIVPFAFDKIVSSSGMKLLNQPVYLSKEHGIGNFKQLHEKKNQEADNDLSNVNQLYNNIDKEYSDKINAEAETDIERTSDNRENYTDPNVPKNPYLAWIYNKLKHPTWLKVDFQVHPQYTDTSAKRFRYAYALSGWFYINPQPPNTRSAYTKYTNILKYGNKVKLEYNGQLNSLRVMGEVASTDNTSAKNKLVEIYETKDVLYQKWNNIVFNYDNGFIDVFLNGKLVGSLSGVAPYMSFDNIVAGSQNGILGGICNVTYYDKPLSKSNIELYYKSLSSKEYPYIWSVKDDFNINIKNTGVNQTFINQIKNTFGIST
jgi:hypothetical protein